MATVGVDVHNVAMTDPQLVADAVRELYGSPAECFVAIRKAWVLKARAAKDRAAATAIAALRKPTRSADLLNQLAQAEPSAIEDLLQVGTELRRAQRTADAPRLRELTARRRELVGELVRLLSRFDDAITPAIRDEVVATFGAAMVDDAVARGLRSGTLTRAGSWDGFGPDVSAQLTVVRSPVDEPTDQVEPDGEESSGGPGRPRPGLRLVTTADEDDAEAGPDDDGPHDERADDGTDGDRPDDLPDDGSPDPPEDEEPELSDRQLRDLSRAQARRLTREEEQRRREAAQAELSSWEERRAAQRSRRREEATADARRRLDQAVSAHQLAKAGLDDLDTEIDRLTRSLEHLRQDREDQERLTERAERAVLRARTEWERILPTQT